MFGIFFPNCCDGLRHNFRKKFLPILKNQLTNFILTKFYLPKIPSIIILMGRSSFDECFGRTVIHKKLLKNLIKNSVKIRLISGSV